MKKQIWQQWIRQATSNKLKTVHYKIQSSKIQSKLKIGLIADLHSCDYGQNQQELMQAVIASKPDIVLLAGDIIDDVFPIEKALELFSEVSQKYPVYYVSGNHELRKYSPKMLNQILNKYGIRMLAGETVHLLVGNQEIDLSGVNDWSVDTKFWRIQSNIKNRKEHIRQKVIERFSLLCQNIGWSPFRNRYKKWLRELKSCAQKRKPNNFSILLVHRPEWIKAYLPYQFDLVVAGHAHGGQWRLPPIMNGLYTPNQGFFPKYAGGKYIFPKTTMIISRGLAREKTRIPRIFNRPEYVVIHLQSK